MNYPYHVLALNYAVNLLPMYLSIRLLIDYILVVPKDTHGQDHLSYHLQDPNNHSSLVLHCRASLEVLLPVCQMILAKATIVRLRYIKQPVRYQEILLTTALISLIYDNPGLCIYNAPR